MKIDLKFKINTYVLIKELENTKAFITGIEIYGLNDFDVWYMCRWFIDGKPVQEKFLYTELKEVNK